VNKEVGFLLKITILYDNTVYKKGLESDHGFSCFIEIKNKPKILFDTGTKANILLNNMEKMKVTPDDIDIIFISHYHNDHTGGLEKLLEINKNIKTYIPISFKFKSEHKVIAVDDAIEIFEDVYSTGELKNIEQSLIIKKENEVTIISGCAHSKVENILDEANKYGKIKYIIGGLHGFDKYEILENVEYVCGTHCTKKQVQIKNRYPDKWIQGGVGRIINV